MTATCSQSQYSGSRDQGFPDKLLSQTALGSLRDPALISKAKRDQNRHWTQINFGPPTHTNTRACTQTGTLANMQRDTYKQEKLNNN